MLIQSSTLSDVVPFNGHSKNKKMIAAINTDNYEKSSKSNQLQDKTVPRIQEDYIFWVSEEIEATVTKKIAHEFRRTESRILDAPSKLEEVILRSEFQVHSGSVPKTSRNSNGENQKTYRDGSPNDHHPEVGVSMCQSSQNFDPGKTSHKFFGKRFFNKFLCKKPSGMEVVHILFYENGKKISQNGIRTATNR